MTELLEKLHELAKNPRYYHGSIKQQGITIPPDVFREIVEAITKKETLTLNKRKRGDVVGAEPQ